MRSPAADANARPSSGSAETAALSPLYEQRVGHNRCFGSRLRE